MDWPTVIAGASLGTGLMGTIILAFGDSFIVRRLNGRYLKTEVAAAHLSYIREALERLESKVDRLSERGL